jgi:hypothetical protein
MRGKSYGRMHDCKMSQHPEVTVWSSSRPIQILKALIQVVTVSGSAGVGNKSKNIDSEENQESEKIFKRITRILCR